MIQNNEKAFTMVEILIVVVIIGIMVTMAVPRMDFSFAKNNLRTSTSSVTQSLYLARMKAVNDGEDYGVQFSENGIINVVKYPYGTPESVGPHSVLEKGITFNNITFVDDLVVFNSLGQLDNDCLPAGNLTGSIVLYCSDTQDSTSVEVTFITGRIRETNL